MEELEKLQSGMNFSHRVLYFARKVLRMVTITGQANGVLDH